MALKYDPDFEEARIGLGRVLIASEKPDLALAHLQKAVSLNPANEVAYYQLWRVYKALGKSAEQERALAEFQRLRAQKAREQGPVLPREVTKQELDSEAVR